MSERLTAEYDVITGDLSATFPESMTGDTAMGLLAHLMYSVYVRTLKDDASFPVSAYGKVCIQLENGKLSMAFGLGDTPATLTADPVRAKGLLIAAYLALCENTATGEFDAGAALVEGLRL